MDFDGNLAAATSTGGLLGNEVGRIGDTPIAGMGVFADNDLGFYSCLSMLLLHYFYIFRIEFHKQAFQIHFRCCVDNWNWRMFNEKFMRQSDSTWHGETKTNAKRRN